VTQDSGTAKVAEWMGCVALAIALYVLWQIRQMLLLIFSAVVIATALNSLIRRLQKLGLPRSSALVLTFVGVILAGSLVFGLIVPPFINQFQRLLVLLPSGFRELAFALDTLRDQRPAWLPNLPDARSLVTQLTPTLEAIVRNSLSFFSDSLNVLLQTLLVLVLALMLLANPNAYRQAFIQLFPSFYRRRADQILSECEIALGNWLGGILINSVFIFALSGISLWILRIPLVLAHAFLAGLLNFIPNIGPTLSVIFPVTIALLDRPWKAIAVIVVYIVIQQIESYWLTPTVMERQVSLLPAFTLIAQIFFATTFGLLGLLLALPLAVVTKVWIQEALIRDVLDPWQQAPLPHPPVSPAQSESTIG
jgi:predicted PurR-regulated permease PerM